MGLERHVSERAGFASVDKSLGLDKLKAEEEKAAEEKAKASGGNGKKSPRKSAGGGGEVAESVDTATAKVTDALVASNRLMKVDEVPEGFVLAEDSDEDDD